MNHSVLFVDDNPVILKAVQIAFAKESYAIFVAESGEQGLVIAEKERPSVIVADLRMPGMNGIEFLHQARAIYDDWIGIIFSAHSDLDSIVAAVNDEVVWRYIIKPWADGRELVMAVNNAIQYLEAKKAKIHAEEVSSRSKHLAALGRLSSGIAHQFNNINVCIIGYAEMAKMKENALPPNILEYLEIITKSARRATEIINDLQNFSNYSSNKFSPHNISEVAKDAISMLQKELDNNGILVDKKFKSQLTVDVDYGLIRLLITNLINNAWQATIGGYAPEIFIETGEEDGRVFIKVADKGCGIPQKHVLKIFEPFFSTKGVHADPESPEAAFRGVGLGLSMSNTIAESHGGRLLVESEPGKGSTFTLWLPKDNLR
jgi:signal transduction histidine kinase